MMDNDKESVGLKGLWDVVPKLAPAPKWESSNTILASVAIEISEFELKNLNSGELAIKKISNQDGEKVELIGLQTIPIGSKILIEVPRRPGHIFVGTSLDDLLNHSSALEKEPLEYLLFGISNELDPFWSASESEIPPAIHSYRSAIRFIDILRDEADVITDSPRCFTFFDVGKIEIEIRYTQNFLSGEIPADELRGFLSCESLQGLRKETFKGTLWDKLKHYDSRERLERLLKGSRGISFLQALRHNFTLAQQDFRLDRRLEVARKEQREFADQISKIILGLEAKALVIPGTLLLAAKFLKVDDGITFTNVLLSLSTLLLALILNYGLCTQKQITENLESEISEAKDRLGEGLEDAKITHKFSSLEKRITLVNHAKRGIVTAAWLIFIGTIIIFCLPKTKSIKPTESTTLTIHDTR